MYVVILLWFFICGAVIGSFLNVVIYRFNTGKSINGRSHCLSCGTGLSWYELIPIFSYLLQGGVCRHCRARITRRYLLVEVFTGVLFVFVAVLFLPDLILVLLNLLITSVLVVIMVYDLRHTIIPDKLVAYLLVLALGYILWDSFTHSLLEPLYERALGGIVPAAFLGGLWLISSGRWIGLGDAKLALPLGLIVGFLGSISMLLFAFWIGAIVSIGILLLQKIGRVPRVGVLFNGSRLTIKSEVPFAPFLLCSFFLVHLMHLDAFNLVDILIAHPRI